jgi:hypothetical protein
MRLFAALVAAFTVAPVPRPQEVTRDIAYAAAALEQQVPLCRSL